MATSKPISTISYNTLDFLVPRLESLVAGEILQAWFFIPHNAETHKDDEVKGKAHIHLLLMPNKRVDLVKLAKMFVEVDPAKPDKPLKCISCFRSSWVNCPSYGSIRFSISLTSADAAAFWLTLSEILSAQIFRQSPTNP